MLESVVDFIFGAEPAKTELGSKLVLAAAEKAKPEFDKKKQRDQEYRTNFRDIKTYDLADNMCWVDYMSWMSMPRKMQQKISELLDPRSWRGVVFQYSLWEQHEVDIARCLTPDYVIVITKDFNNKYRLHTIPLYKSYIDWATPAKFKELDQRISSTAFLTYGKSKDNVVYVLDREDNVRVIL